MVSYGDIQIYGELWRYTDDHVYYNIYHFSSLGLEREFSLSSMTIVVNLSEGSTYLASLFVLCMSRTPRVFDSKMCACD